MLSLENGFKTEPDYFSWSFLTWLLFVTVVAVFFHIVALLYCEYVLMASCPFT